MQISCICQILKFSGRKYIIFKRKSPLRIDPFLNHTRNYSQREGGGGSWKHRNSDRGMKERRVNDDRKTSRCLRTTVSAHHAVFPSISSSVCRSLSFLFSGSIQISPRLSSSFFSLPVVISHHSLSSSLCFFLSTCSQHTFSHFSVSTAVSFLALHLFFSLQSCLEIIFLLRENQSLRTQVVSTGLLPPTHTHTNLHTAPHTHKKNSNTENMQQNNLQCSWVYLCVLICRMPGWPH